MNQVSICSNNGLSPIRRQAIIWTSARFLSIGPLGTNFSEILIKKTLIMKGHLETPSAKWLPFCLARTNRRPHMATCYRNKHTKYEWFWLQFGSSFWLWRMFTELWYSVNYLFYSPGSRLPRMKLNRIWAAFNPNQLRQLRNYVIGNWTDCFYAMMSDMEIASSISWIFQRSFLTCQCVKYQSIPPSMKYCPKAVMNASI